MLVYSVSINIIVFELVVLYQATGTRVAKSSTRV